MTFLITGFELETENIIDEIDNFYNILAIIFFPILSFLLYTLFFTNQVDIVFGICLLALSPATVASGTILTRIAKGNITLSIIICIFTNTILIFIFPFYLNIFIKLEKISLHLSYLNMLSNLAYSILIPILVGQILKVKLQNLSKWALKLFIFFYS